MTDRDLLSKYSRDNDQRAFAELVQRHVHWVNSMALRLVNGNSAQAADVTQAAFILLARKAATLRPDTLLSGWLFIVTKYAAAKSIREESRRRLHERRAAEMRQEQGSTSRGSTQWEPMAAMLDELVHRLRAADRDAVLLRFYEKKSFSEVGESLNISEEAARKRVSRAIEQLRAGFARRGIAVGAVALAATMSANLTQPASAAVIAGTTTAASAGAASPLLQSAVWMMAWTSLKPVLAVGIVLALSAILAVVALQSAPAQQAATSPTTAPTIVSPQRFGRVVAQDGKPVAGARVWQLRSSSRPQDEPLVESTSTDAEGRFEFAAPGDGVWAFAIAPGYGWSTAIIRSHLQNDPDEIRLESSTTMRISFKAPDGKPAAGLRVRLASAVISGRHGRIDFPAGLNEPGLIQTTDDKGTCSFPNLPQDGDAHLQVMDERFVQLAEDEPFDLSDSNLTEAGVVQLQTAASISGRVVLPDGTTPLAGVHVLAKSDSSVDGDAWTDAQGRYALKQLPARKYIVGLSLTEEIIRQYASTDLEGIRIAPGMERTEQNFKLITGAIVQGRMTEKGTDRPLAGMRVVAGPMKWQPPPRPATTTEILSGADGRYLIHVPAGQGLVEVSSLLPAGLSTPATTSNRYDIPNAQTFEANFEYLSTAVTTIKGHAVDSAGQPLANAEIYLQSASDIPPGQLVTITDASGAFSVQRWITRPNSQQFFLLRARKGNLTTQSPVDITSASATSDVSIALHPDSSASVRVKLQQPDGKPIPGAKVILTETGDVNPHFYDERKTDSEGTCVFRRLDPDHRYGIAVRVNGFDNVEQVKVPIQAGKQTDVPPIILARADQVVAGIVIDENGDPVLDARVMLSGDSRPMADGLHRLAQITYTDLFGHFRFESVLGTQQVRLLLAMTDDPPPHQASGRADNVAPGTENLVITLYKASPRSSSGPAR